MKKKKGFTLVELLVVIAIIALLMGILMPALARVRQIAYRLYCGTNLSGLGKAMLIYSNDYDDEMPRAGGPTSVWGDTQAFAHNTRVGAFGLSPADYSGGAASITASFYMLVKYAEVTPKSFLCKGDSGADDFKTSDHPAASGKDLIELWDFGGPPTQLHCSYAYHMPYGPYPLNTSSEPGMAVAADPNPWQNQASQLARPGTDWADFDPLGSREDVIFGNAQTHQDYGQNVLFMDAHVTFEKSSACGINDDNIYTTWKGTDSASADKTYRPLGVRPTTPLGTGTGPGQQPQYKLDSFLVTDGGGGGGGKSRGCFLADTLVWVDGAMVHISKVVPGQMVEKPLVAQTAVCLQKAACSLEIEGIDVHDEPEPWQCYDVVLENGNSITVADSHFFLLDSGQWVTLQKLASGSKLATPEGPITVKSVNKKAIPFYGKVYNLKVKNGERYLVGKDGVIVRDW